MQLQSNQLQTRLLKELLDSSLKEDHGIKGDITANALIDNHAKVDFTITNRENIVVCGIPIAEYFFQNHSTIKYKILHKDGELASAGSNLIIGTGEAKEILFLERVILNYLQHLSGVATITNKYVSAVSGTKAKICDTRKTLPLHRTIQKYAVTCGGGYNHRLSLDSSILIKDNHIAICGGIKQAINKAKIANSHYTKIEIECDNIEQVKEAVQVGVDIIMLDNMTLDKINEAITIINGRSLIEVSGGVNIDNVKNIAKTGVDIISVGKLTHSAKAVDISLNIQNKNQ